MSPSATTALAPTKIDPSGITGWVLAGGRGSRMGGVDKGLQLHAGVPLAVHAMRRLLPQVGGVAINANRQVDVYASFGVAVHSDSLADHPGPLGGFLAGLEHCTRPYLMTVPCDAPNFPCDVVARLAAELIARHAPLAMAATRGVNGLQPQPVFCLMASHLRQSLLDFTASGQRKPQVWAELNGCAWVVFDDEAAFVNANTHAELQALQPEAGYGASP
jgi:molybdopterin-guanine dinucleotide biosynthesis protein A